MTPSTLLYLLGLGLVAAGAARLILAEVCKIPRVWLAATQARPLPAATSLAVAGLLCYTLRWLAFSPRWPIGGLFDPIECTRFCGWTQYYSIVIEALRLLSVAGLGVVAAILPALVMAVLGWLDAPVTPDEQNYYTNKAWLRRQWKIRRLERDIVRSVAASMNASGDLRTSAQVRRVDTKLDSTSAVTLIRVDPAPDNLDELIKELAQPLIQSVDITDSDYWDIPLVRVHWDLAKIDPLPIPDRQSGDRPRRTGLVAGAVGVAGSIGVAVVIAAVAVAMTTHDPGSRALPPGSSGATWKGPATASAASPRPPDRPVPFIMGASACRPTGKNPDICGTGGQVFTLDIEGPWVITQVGFSPARLVPGRVVTRVRWEFSGPEPAVFEQDIRDSSVAPTLAVGDPSYPDKDSVLAALRPGGYHTSTIAVTVLNSAAAPAVEPPYSAGNPPARILVIGSALFGGAVTGR